jgi:hypothetical protein
MSSLLRRAMPSYIETISAVRAACAAITLTYSREGDGRLESAAKEGPYLEALKSRLATCGHTVEITPPRYWYDVRIDGIPFNLKLTDCASADNVFDKVSIHYTICGMETAKKNMNIDEWWAGIMGSKSRKAARDRATEYHFIVVNKRTGATLVKSLVDIHTYKKNPCNILQIAWANEFTNQAYEVPDAGYKAKIAELLGTVRTSLAQRRATEDAFMAADFSAL